MTTIFVPPIKDSVIELNPLVPARSEPFYLAAGWVQWLQDALIPRVEKAPQRLITKTLTNQSAAISATPLAIGAVSAGLYRLSYYVRVTTVDAVSSSVTVTLRWTEGGLPLSIAFAALTTNTTASVQSGTITVQADQNASLSYSTAYASNTPSQMRYELVITAEKLP